MQGCILAFIQGPGAQQQPSILSRKPSGSTGLPSIGETACALCRVGYAAADARGGEAGHEPPGWVDASRAVAFRFSLVFGFVGVS